MKIRHHILIIFLLVSGTVYAQTDTTAFQEPLLNFDYNKPTFKLEAEQLSNNNKFLRFFVITGYREGVKPVNAGFGMHWGVYEDPSTGVRRIAMYNLTIPELINFSQVDTDRLILNVKDPSKYLYKAEYGDQENWNRKNTYCYEMVLPASVYSINSVSEMKVDLCNAFGVTLKIEKRMTDDQHRYGLKVEVPNQEVEVLVLTEKNQ